jgi:hydroxypyruvate reductase
LFGPHPVPDVASQETLAQIRGFIKKIPETAEMIVAISGGTSSIIADPVPFVTISDKARVTRDLIDSGAPIEVINSLRIHLSRIKGGGLAELIAPRKSLYYVFSDIPGEDPTLVGSAPMTRIDREGGSALSALNFWLKGTVPKSVSAALENRERLYHPDPSGQNEPFFGGAIASSETLLARAREIFLAHDLYDDSRVHILTDRLGGEAREAGIVLSSLVLWHSRQSSQRSAWLAAGETTVRLPSNIAGKGGRSLELGLSLALELRKQRAIVLSLASDGWDGNSGLAGTLIATGLLDPAPMCRDAMEALASHNTGPFLRTHAMAVETGPTGSNLNDLLLVLLNP